MVSCLYCVFGDVLCSACSCLSTDCRLLLQFAVCCVVFEVRWVVFVVCSLLADVCCLLPAVCRLLYEVCWLLVLFSTCCMVSVLGRGLDRCLLLRFVFRCVVFVICCLLFGARFLLPVVVRCSLSVVRCRWFVCFVVCCSTCAVGFLF